MLAARLRGVKWLFKLFSGLLKASKEGGVFGPEEIVVMTTTLLVPIDWPVPFGLVMIEATACGTPVIAFNRGSAVEVIDDGLTGFIVEDEAGAIGAVDRLAQLSRGKIRQRFEERFTARRMALDYLAVPRELLESTAPRLRLVVD